MGKETLRKKKKERRATTRSRGIDSLGGVGAGSREKRKGGRAGGGAGGDGAPRFISSRGRAGGQGAAVFLRRWALPGRGSSTRLAGSARHHRSRGLHVARSGALSSDLSPSSSSIDDGAAQHANRDACASAARAVT